MPPPLWCGYVGGGSKSRFYRVFCASQNCWLFEEWVFAGGATHAFFIPLIFLCSEILFEVSGCKERFSHGWCSRIIDFPCVCTCQTSESLVSPEFQRIRSLLPHLQLENHAFWWRFLHAFQKKTRCRSLQDRWGCETIDFLHVSCVQTSKPLIFLGSGSLRAQNHWFY